MKPFFFLALKAAVEMHVHVYMFLYFYKVQILLAEKDLKKAHL